ncbi:MULTISPECIES: 4-oxalomesaconate tautomerase [Yersinia]|uniref:4-oxalomesaconate tautomerase n=1 Tax=Yersinia TaxID=629 RepID=UPI00119E9213|nr:4-oxalomesaconate tautomerase [Yersinia rochesterensis]MDA5546013.1 4-oxalomesaconate tautomerase [Yersinia rochesterensis]MDN0108692.1 4-oxalomesaconate tautomerase [Yersinia rochesterensis]UZM75624.1 4-oxalomesaconate tautomerase [Yersinia sp. SCPM-O-B-9106 (C-191)]
MKTLPCWFMRGGTSKGPFFLATDLPKEIAERDRIILSVMGSPDERQIDGLGGATTLTSKVGILSLADDALADINFLFAQVSLDDAIVDTTPNCGNMLAAAGPAAIEAGLIVAQGDQTVIRIRTLNTNMIAEVTLQTPGGKPAYTGDAHIDGVPGTSAPVLLNFLDTAGSVCGSLLPTGQLCDVIDGIRVTCIDNGMPVIIVAAEDMGISGYETKEQLNADTELAAHIERLRLQAGAMMGIKDLANKSVPKISMVARPQKGGTLCTRTFIPRTCHAAIGVLGAVTVATAAVLPGSVAHDLADLPGGNEQYLSIEHPSGELSVFLKLSATGDVEQAALMRTARLIMRGEALIP